MSNGFFDVPAGNPMSVGAPSHRTLAAIREHYPLYIHGVGTSIGSKGAFLRFAQATGKLDP
ncbi:multinuclear nonheme iron-dependent oxidase [Paraburkholderia largidicola]|uniref:multinuclear nonheme iron-dependent oxidase n=1 Tax=Paraburkholderia largidicola TaxID=3014751 RepID=UPI003312F9AC